jgi:hypothetical protein
MDPVMQHQVAWTHLALMMALCAMITLLIQVLDHNKNAILWECLAQLSIPMLFL